LIVLPANVDDELRAELLAIVAKRWRGFKLAERSADCGAIGNISPAQVFVVTDFDVPPLWGSNFGVGIGATSATHRFDWGRHSPID
jgi:hypothetical protein